MDDGVAAESGDCASTGIEREARKEDEECFGAEFVIIVQVSFDAALPAVSLARRD